MSKEELSVKELAVTALFSREDVEVLDREPVYQGFFKMEKVRLRHRLFAGGWSQPLERELFVRGDAVAAILYDPRRDLIGLIEQFRIGALDETCGPWCLEVVAGIADCGGSLEEVVRRELMEEAGVQPEQLEYICNYLSSPGGTNEKLHLYCALTDLKDVGGLFGLAEEGEDIRVQVLGADEVFDAMLKGRFNNAATLICLQWLQLNRPRFATD